MPESPPIVTLIHATPAAIGPVVEALRAIGPLQVLNQLDEALLSEIDRHGGLTRECVDRMAVQLRLARDAGSSVILTTCNAYSTTILRELRPAMPEVPIVVIDEPMVRRALENDRVTVIATVRSGLESQQSLFDALGNDGRDRRIDYVLREDAFADLADGRSDEHDAIIRDEADRALADGAIVVLAQASMARVLPLVPAAARDRVLTSPPLAAAEVQSALSRVAASR